MNPNARLAYALLAASLIATVAIGEESPRFTPVTMQAKEATPGEIFPTIGRAGGVEFIPPGSWGVGNDILVNFEMKEQPFWIAALQAASIYGYTFDTTSFSPNDRRVNIYLGKPRPARKMLLAPPLVIMAGISKTQATSLELITYADPAIKDWVFAGPPEITELTDTAGESLLPTESKPALAAPAGLVARHPVRMTRIVPEIGSLKGSLVMLFADEIDEWSFDQPSLTQPQERVIGDTTYRVTSLRKRGKQYLLELRTKGPADGGFVAGAAELTVGTGSILASDAAGNRWRITEIKGNYKAREASATGEYTYAITLVSEKAAGDIARITWRIPTKMSNIEIPFAFDTMSIR